MAAGRELVGTKGFGCEANVNLKCSVMNVLDLIKATITCGVSAFLIYNFPIIGQVLIIGLLFLLWLSYAHRTLATLRRR